MYHKYLERCVDVNALVCEGELAESFDPWAYRTALKCQLP